ncbi:MAG: Unknown protein [uncultured Sulfurovum sp.]|uniref:Rho termination factor N-terminal domain-containing protein n=1 Tax=uncultured Sulfurovum sp. TaxID=269237 RepID=A0A6S6T0E1_9BACT|nr:MAG: Unknown protein [uncultured Sulfurovum sp.]
MKIEFLKKDELVTYCKNLNISTVKKNKNELLRAIYTSRS